MLDKFIAYTELLIKFVNENDNDEKEEIKFNLHLIEAGFYPYWKIKCSEKEDEK